ncbi:MAG: hypothetical protein ACOZQL_24125 [Myxococcota bacterium]
MKRLLGALLIGVWGCGVEQSSEADVVARSEQGLFSWRAIDLSSNATAATGVGSELLGSTGTTPRLGAWDPAPIDWQLIPGGQSVAPGVLPGAAGRTVKSLGQTAGYETHLLAKNAAGQLVHQIRTTSIELPVVEWLPSWVSHGTMTVSSGVSASGVLAKDASLDLFVRGVDGQVYMDSYLGGFDVAYSQGAPWTGFIPLGGTVLAGTTPVGITTITNGVVQRDIFVNTGGLYSTGLAHRYWLASTGWSAWESIGGFGKDGVVGTPSVIREGSKIAVYVLGPNSHVYKKTLTIGVTKGGGRTQSWSTFLDCGNPGRPLDENFLATSWSNTPTGYETVVFVRDFGLIYRGSGTCN